MRSTLLVSLLVCALAPGSRAQPDRDALLRAAQGSVPAGEADRTLSPYFFVLSDDPTLDALPLKSTSAEVSIAGVIAQVKVAQVYRNEGRRTLEAIYIFPLSTRAAVFAMTMRVGDRTLRAEIREREKARKEYEQAKAEGRTASLLEQQRPNVFQMNVANILPGDEIRVEVSYSELLVPEAGTYEFVFPTVVGPRYTTRTAEDAAPEDRFTENPTLHAGASPAFSLALAARIHGGMELAAIDCPSHPVEIERSGDREAFVALRDDPTAANRDFVLRYSFAGDAVQTGLLLYPGKEENFFLLMMEPPRRAEPAAILPREYVFILDVSGSMGGFPLETSKALMRDLLADLRGEDSFNVLVFSGGSGTLWERSRPASAENLRNAMAFIDRLGGGGGTEILPALQRALALPRTAGASRILVIATDGYVAVEKEAFALIQKNLGDASFFAFGIGASVNRHLIEGMARAGLGEPFVVLSPGEAPTKAEAFRRYVASPLLQDVRARFEGFDAYDVEPDYLPVLFAERPVVVFGKYRGEPRGSVSIEGELRDRKLSGTLEVAAANLSEDNAALRQLWARHRIAALEDMRALGETRELTEAITRLGLTYSLMTAHTSFMAVDTVVRADGSRASTVRQPLPMPAGVSDLAVGNGVLGCMGKGAGGGGFGYGGLGTMGIKGRVGGVSASMGTPVVTGSLDPTLVRRVIRRHQAEIRTAYARLLKSHPALAGKIVVKFTIGKDGKVKNAVIASDTTGSKELKELLLEKIKAWVFPIPKGGGEIVISYPFVFTPSGR